jgi:hypothetical protein
MPMMKAFVNATLACFNVKIYLSPFIFKPK